MQLIYSLLQVHRIIMVPASLVEEDEDRKGLAANQ
jgi:hypothetical protein